MYLSKLEIFGFKSFAQKTVFQFADGLTAIIGPNGCGKSNIVDAVRWVLGEQRPSVLRCERMENLIFNGTATRKPLNMVEVSIYIENTRNILPSEYTEIKITRRLYRSGESEYLINNQTARLMDIVNLFADTGMGADAYSVIELKMVEQILSDNAQERRRLFEEAAGIKRYKARRRSALLKLETTEQELTRVDDIIAEVQKTVNSLSRQVGKARRYHEIKQQLKEKEILLACLKITAFEQELQPLRTEQEQVGKTREMLAKEVHLQEADLEEQRRRLVEMEHQYRQIAAEVYRQDEALKEKQNRRQLRQQRIRSLQETITAYEQELTAQQQKKTHLEAEKADLETSLGQLRQQMSEAQERYRQTANRQLEAREAYEQCREAYQNFIKSNVEALQASESRKEQFQRVRVEKENVQTNLTRLQETQERFLAEARNRQETLDADEATRAALAEDLALYAQEQQLLQERIQESKQGQEALRQQLNRMEGELEKLRNRRSFLENLIRNYEGFSESVQYVMTHRQEFTGIVDTLANLVDCPPEYRPALESYLAEVANYLVVEEVETARKILHQLRHRGKGRLTVVPLPLLRPNHRPGADELPGEGAQGLPLKQVVTFPQSYANLFHALFDAVYLVDDLETAIALRRDYPEVTYVTREGEVLHQWGNLTGGAAANGVGLIGRKEEFRRVEQLIGEKEAHLTALQEELEQATTTLEAREKKLEEFRQLHQSVQQQLMELEQRIGRQQYEIGRLQETAEELAEQVADHRQRLQELEAQEQQLLPEMTRLEEQARTYQLREQELRQAQQTAETRLQELDEQTRQHQMVYLDLVSREKELLQKMQFTEESLKESGAFMANRRQRIEEAHREIAALEAECAALQTDLEAGYRERDALAQQKDDLERKVEEFRATIQHKETELKKKQRLLVQARERLQEIEMRIRELEIKLDTVREQITEKYGRDALQLSIHQIDATLSLGDVQGEIETLRQKLERLGEVNPFAVKEYEKEKERLEFLLAQREDLLTAREQLLETIRKLNATARKQFMETFRKIQENFQRVFREFFDGGTAELVLVESNDPLEANIDIVVSHKGKKINTLALLSAGEKTLTAISLLFAIYLVKPSPFCILDEVDAPLDDVNIARFTHALAQFARDTQFILVTHNKKTMEAADTLYGITMEEPGVSKVVSVRLE